MPEVRSYKPGMFSWVDLNSPDPEASKDFYGAIFGWQAEDLPSGENDIYTMFSLKGRTVAACYKMRDDQKSAPPFWFNYFTVTSADATASKAKELGAQVQEPFDVMDVGRMAIIGSPTGEWFAVWEPKGTIGAELVNEHGTLIWNELWSTDVPASRAFYTELFGWTCEEYDANYAVFSVDGRGSNGLQPVPEQMTGHPSYWLTYFAVDDVDKVAEVAASKGAKVLDGPRDSMGVGRFATLQDPHKAAFAIIASEGEPPPIDW